MRKRHPKFILYFFILSLLLLPASCGRDSAPAPRVISNDEFFERGAEDDNQSEVEITESPIQSPEEAEKTSKGGGNENNLSGSEETAIVPAPAQGGAVEEDGPMAIVWDVTFSPSMNFGAKWRPTISEMLPVKESKIASALSERFGVLMESVRSEGVLGPNDSQKRYMMRTGRFPDIFRGANVTDVNELINLGLARQIPWDMVERYAPCYFAMISSDEALSEKYITDGNHRHMLPAIRVAEKSMNLFSVYRLDWLEEINMQPRGQLIHLRDNDYGIPVYFTEEAFDIHEFIEIMEGFSGLHIADGRRWAAALDDSDLDMWPNYMRPLTGMFGITMETVNEDGKAKLWYASEAYRSYLEFMSRIVGFGGVATGFNEWMTYPSGRHLYTDEQGFTSGWFTSYMRLLNYPYSTLNNRELSLFQPGAKFLITPPEIGLNGVQGIAYTHRTPGTVTDGSVWFINAGVSDAKLAKIFEIWDAVSFEPELYALVNFGIEGEDYVWAGAPFGSPVEFTEKNDEHKGLFATGVEDGSAGKEIYTAGCEILYNFSVSGRAVEMVRSPYKNEYGAGFAEESSALGEQFPFANLVRVRDAFYSSVLRGEKDIFVAAVWDEYISELELNGLSEWNALYERMPANEG